MGGQPRGEYGHREDHPATETGNIGICIHHLPVGQIFWSSNLQDLTEHVIASENMDQVVKNVFNGDGLTAGLGDPPRDDHDW